MLPQRQSKTTKSYDFSMSTKVTKASRHDTYIFKVHEQINHRTSHLNPQDGNSKNKLLTIRYV